MNGTVEKKQLVWIITGTSSGFGRRLVTFALSRGDRVIATARSLQKLDAELALCDLSDSEKANLRTLELDITAGEDALKEKVNHAATFWGRIDVLVNNAGMLTYLIHPRRADLWSLSAGFGQPGLVEEGGTRLARQQFEVNVFGLLDMTTATLPHIRESKGVLVNIGSRSSWHNEIPGLGFYASSKAAVQSFTETIATEVAGFGVRTVLVAPGAFRTEGIYSGQWGTENNIPAYDTLRDTSFKRFNSIPGTEKGDPAKAMELLVDVVRGEGKAAGRPFPRYLVLGEDAHGNAIKRAQQVTTAVEEWRDLTGKAVQFD